MSDKINWQTEIANDLVGVFDLAKGEDFEDGVETEFSQKLEQFIEHYGSQAISAIQAAYNQKKFPEQYFAEALLWIGDMEHDSTRNLRRNLLENALKSESVFIRDAAVTGLSYLSDPRSIQPLSEALEKELAEGIRTNIEGVLAYLRKIQSDSFYGETSPLDKILGIFDDDITDMSTSVRDTMDKLHRKMYESTD